MSFAEVAHRLTRILGDPVDYSPVPDETKRETLLDHGLPAWNADLIIEYLQAYADGWGDFATSDFADIVGHPPRDVDDFLRDHLAAFS